DDKWSEVAHKVGMPAPDIIDIHDQTKLDLTEMIEQEYKYVTEHYQIFDGSPQFAWEGIKLGHITELDMFRELKVSKEGGCKSK
ncbi:MAG: hypothetical protein AAF492_27275, partial [Verrucomicrobiota bacterium]